MATYTSNTVAQTNTTGVMRPHVAFVEALLTAAGWVQTADTGQTASGAFPAATGTNTVAGYQIWRMNDTLQATVPVFVKIEFGSGSVANTLGLWITIGTGSNGSGTITGIIGGNRFNVPQAATSASSLPNYGSGSTSRVVAVHCYITATTQCTIMWGIERSKDSAGADTSAGVIFDATWGPNTSNWHQFLPFTGTVRPVYTGICMPVPNSGLLSLIDGANIGMMPLIPMAQTGPLEPGLNYLGYYGPDLPTGVDVVVTVRGASRTYKPLGAPHLWSYANNAWTNSCWAIRYE